MDKNQEKNIRYYNKLYRNASIERILYKLENLTAFLDDATKTDTSWVGLYKMNFKDELFGKKVLELGCGDCTNAAVMAALGAKVFANDISHESGMIIKKLNNAFEFPSPIKFIEGDFLKAKFEEKDFDFVVGKAFLHHLTHPIEKKFLEKIIYLLKPNGEARFFEPAVNNVYIDKIRWLFPVSGRPSKLNKKAFLKWKENDPHPERDNSSTHFEKLGKQFFKQVYIIPLGMLERFHKFLPKEANHRKFRRLAFDFEKKLPAILNLRGARSQVIIYREPLKY